MVSALTPPCQDTMIYGSGDYCYKKVFGWGSERTLGIATAVAVDSQDHVYVVDREPHPAVVVYDRDGRLVNEWGQETLVLPHEIWIDEEDTINIPDCGDHTVRLFSTDGVLLQTLGLPNQPGGLGEPFNMPTRVVKGPSGDLYVSDGYGQCYVHRMTPSGDLIKSWGGKGEATGMFTLPHNIFPTSDGRLVVADRETNNRIQVFDLEGEFLAEWLGRPHPCGLFIDENDTVYLAEGGGITIMNMDGRLIAQFCVVMGGPDDRPHGAHSVWVDRYGDIYIGEVGVENLVHKFIRI